MIKFVEHKNINKHKWDFCISESSNSIFFVYSWYLDIVCPSWGALVFNDYEAVFPLAVKSKMGIPYVHQPYFTRYFGLYVQSDKIHVSINEFIEAIPDKIKYLECCLHEFNHPLPANEYSFSEKKFQQLNLSGDYNELQKNYSDNTKRNIKKANKSGYTISTGINPKKIIELFKMTKGKELKVFKEKNYQTLLTLMNHCIKNKTGFTLGAVDKEKELVAAAFFMKNTNRYLFLNSGVTDQGRAYGAMHFIFDYLICKNSGKNFLLDFGGSSVETVARFYKSFGAEEIVYLQIKKNNLPFPLKLIKK